MSTIIAPKQPYYLKGYTGHCPDMAFRFGHSYSALSHKILLDPLVRHSHKLVLSDTEVADYKLCHKKAKLEKIEEFCESDDGEPLEYDDKFKFPITVGYSGHLPETAAVVAKQRTKEAEKTIPKLRERLKKDFKVQKNIEKINDLRYGRKKIETIADKELLQNEFSLPLIEIRPEYSYIIKNVFKDEKPKKESPRMPYFMEGLDENKYVMKDYTGHVPFGYAKFGVTNQKGTNEALKEFTENYNRMLSTEWAPAGTIREVPAETYVPHKIYSEKHGIIPNYCGYVPGIQFSSGKTYGELTKDAKKWLRGDMA